MRNKLAILLVPALLALTVACQKDRITGGGPTSTEDRAINNFTAISTSGSTDITVLKGTTFNVSVKGYTNLLPYLETVVINNTLQVRFKNHTVVRNDNTEVTVTMPVLNGLSISGSANIVSTGDFSSNNDFNTKISGSGNITLEKGSSKNLASEIAGSGDVHAFGFQVENAKVHISGSGNTHVTASSNLNVEISGSGNVYYKGSPSVSASVSGSGKVQKQ